MLRTTTTSTPLVQAESQSQSSVAVSAPITTQIAEPEPTPMDIVSEPETKVSEPIPTTETRTPIGFRQPNETDIKAFRKMLSGRSVRTKSKDGQYKFVYYSGDDIQYLRAEEWEDTQHERDPTFVRISDEEPLVPSRLPRLTSASEGVRRYLLLNYDASNGFSSRHYQYSFEDSGMLPLEYKRSREILFCAELDNTTLVPRDSDLANDARAWFYGNEYMELRAEYDRVLFRILDIHFTDSIEDSANVISLFTIPTTDLDTSSSVAEINMVYVTPINCRLIQPTDGFVAYTIQYAYSQNLNSQSRLMHYALQIRQHDY